MSPFRIRRLSAGLPGSLMLLCSAPILALSIEYGETSRRELEAIRQQVAIAEARSSQLQRDQPALHQAADNLRGWLPPNRPDKQSGMALQAVNGLFGIDGLAHEWQTGGSSGLTPRQSTHWLERSMHLSFRPLHEGIFLAALKRLHETEDELAVIDNCTLTKSAQHTLKADCSLRWFSLQYKQAEPS